MPRVTHVKRAQQRYATVPVLNEDGTPKRTPVMKGGQQRVTKRGPQYMTVTVQDKTKPLPPYTCDHCRQPILPGTPYKHIKPKSGPYGGQQRNRHEGCPTWQVWEYSNSLSARLAQIEHDATSQLDSVESPDDVQDLLNTAAEAIREVAEEKREGAQNIEDGFGHATSASEELAQIAEDLDAWADEVEGADVPDLPEPEEEECTECGGTGKVDDGEESGDDAEDCAECDGTGSVTPEEPSDDQMSEWRDEVSEALSILSEAPC